MKFIPSRSISGAWFAEVHFDDDETFTNGTRSGINLEWLALHKFGHTFGMKHTNVRQSVMYPWYKGYIKDIKLTSYDIQTLQALYGESIKSAYEMKNNCCLFERNKNGVFLFRISFFVLEILIFL